MASSCGLVELFRRKVRLCTGTCVGVCDGICGLWVAVWIAVKEARIPEDRDLDVVRSLGRRHVEARRSVSRFSIALRDGLAEALSMRLLTTAAGQELDRRIKAVFEGSTDIPERPPALTIPSLKRRQK